MTVAHENYPVERQAFICGYTHFDGEVVFPNMTRTVKNIRYVKTETGRDLLLGKISWRGETFDVYRVNDDNLWHLDFRYAKELDILCGHIE